MFVRLYRRMLGSAVLCSTVVLAGGCRNEADAEGGHGRRLDELPRIPGQPLKLEKCKWDSIVINGNTFQKDVVIDKYIVRERKKGPSKKYQTRFGHTPLSPDEEIPWDCEELVVGTGFQSRLPVMNEVKEEAAKRKVRLILLPTPKAVDYFKTHQKGRNAIFHLTC